jgi:hypothetical protein
MTSMDINLTTHNYNVSYIEDGPEAMKEEVVCPI